MFFRNAFDSNQRGCSDYLLYTVTASSFWTYENESPVECLKLSFKTIFFRGIELFLHKE